MPFCKLSRDLKVAAFDHLYRAASKNEGFWAEMQQLFLFFDTQIHRRDRCEANYHRWRGSFGSKQLGNHVALLFRDQGCYCKYTYVAYTQNYQQKALQNKKKENCIHESYENHGYYTQSSKIGILHLQLVGVGRLDALSIYINTHHTHIDNKLTISISSQLGCFRLIPSH
jgi:hypothetical protein